MANSKQYTRKFEKRKLCYDVPIRITDEKKG